MEEKQLNRNRVRDRKGLIFDEPRKVKLQVFLALFLLAAAMTFTQYGFIGVGANGTYMCYAMGLLAPIAATALLLGVRAGTLQGFLCGAVLLAHASIQPLNPVERYFVSGPNSVGLYTLAGVLLGVFFAVALHNSPTGMRRAVYAGIACLATSVITTFVFLINILVSIVFDLLATWMENRSVSDIPPDVVNAVEALGSLSAQCVLDFILMFATVLLVSHAMRWYQRSAGNVSVRVSFGVQLFVVVSLVFCILSALSYVIITFRSAADAQEDMEDTMKLVGEQFVQSDDALQKIAQSKQFQDVPEDVLDTIVNTSYLKTLVNGYNLMKEGAVVVFFDDTAVFSNSPAYPTGKTTSELFGEDKADYISNLAESGRTDEILYSTNSFKGNGEDGEFHDYANAELGYIRASKQGDYYVMVAKPFSVVFASRQATMTWATLLSFVLFTVVYLLTSRLLGKDVVGPIDRTNESLAQITDGNLDVQVQEHDNVEFTSLSEGINTTVDALKGYIDEAETRMERELATAKAIQKSALPRVFPPFPEVDKFDIFASMNAAKEVGGDFYDYFLIDDHTLGFLIADVSGKGVPGALFMMAAKTELENYMSTGMELRQAIATANMRLCANNDAGMFVTVWAATLDYNTGELTYVNAGHNFPLLRHGFGGEWEWLTKKCGLFLGTFETAKYRQETITLEPGDELLLYTDGVNEAFNVKEEEYGNDRLEEFLAAHPNMHSREIVRSLRADVARWAEGAEQSDDVTILALEYGVAPEVTGNVTVKAVVENLGVATSLVNTELEARLCPLDVQHKVEIALEELFVNVCRYAYADKDEPGMVQVRYAYGTNPSAITVELRDKGVPFDPIKLEDPTRPSKENVKIGGLGILMVRNAMDDFTYMRSGDTNVVVIKKGW